MSALILLGCGRDPLVHDLSERGANRIVTHLHSEGFDAVKRVQPDGRYAVEIEPHEVPNALRYLEETRLLRERRDPPIEGASLTATREDKRFRVERAMSREIEDTLDTMPGVLESRVHLNLPPVDPLFGQKGGERGSGSVLLVADHREAIEAAEVATLVAGAAGIAPGSVAVVVRKTSDLRPSEPPRTEDAPTDNRASIESIGSFAGGLLRNVPRAVRWEIALALGVIGSVLVVFGARAGVKNGVGVGGREGMKGGKV